MAYDFGKPIQAIVELTGKDGGPIASTVDSVVSTMTSEDKRKRIAELLAKAGREAAGGRGGGRRAGRR
jgi:hypothetical protein